MSASDIHATVHCLNSHHEFEAMEVWLKHAQDSDVQVLADFFNHLVKNEPETLYLLKEIYLRSKADGSLQILQSSLAQLLNQPKRNSELVELLKINVGAFLKFSSQPQAHLRIEGWFNLTHAQAYQRLMDQLVQKQKVIPLISSITTYAQDPSAVPFSELFGMLSQSNTKEAWEELLQSEPLLHLQNLAHFIEWLFQSNHYETLNQSLQQLSLKPVQCFNGNKQLANPVFPAIHALTHLDAESAAAYFKHDLRNLYWLAQGYCDFPTSLTSVIALIDEATEVPGFAETYTLIRPLFNDARFIQFLSAPASARFVETNHFLAESYFFQDLVTLVSIDLKSPLSSHGQAFSNFLQTALKQMNESQVRSLLETATPMFNAGAGYGHQLIANLYRVTSNYPDFNPLISDKLSTTLAMSVSALVSLPEFASVLDLTDQLMAQHRLNGFVDQTLDYFHTLFMRGTVLIPERSNRDPTLAFDPISTRLLEKLPFIPRVRNSTCADLAYEWNFAKFDASMEPRYLAQLDSILKCVDTNQSFTSGKELVQYSLRHSELASFLELQRETVNHLFSISTEAALSSFETFLNLGSHELGHLHDALQVSSHLISQTQNFYLPKSSLRTFIGKILEFPQTYRGVEEILGATPPRTRSSNPVQDVAQLQTVNAIISRNHKLTQVKIDTAIQAMIKEYCPSLDEDSPDCDLDKDQLALYLKSPPVLFKKITQEFLESSQTWMHPVLSSGFTHAKEAPSQVSDLEYHLHPALHLIRGNPQTPRAIISAVRQLNNDQLHIANFLEQRAVRLTLIPYIYQVPNYPLTSKREFSDRIRIRLVNDLDRLELIEINADFQAFGLASNLGMNFIREIGLAWGDVPEALRPKNLSLFKSPDQVRTLKEVEEFIETELSKFDTPTLQKVGSCYPRSGGRIHRFIATQLCNHEVFDLSARVFNLRSLVSLLSDELPDKDGGAGGLVYLRDVFYSFYAGNSNLQRDSFADGVNLNSECLESPLPFSLPLRHCQKDILTLISRVTRLGLLHQAGVAILNASDNPVHELGNLIERVSLDDQLSEGFIRTLSQDSGSSFIKDATEFAFQSPPGTAKMLSLLSQSLSAVPDSNFLRFGLELVSLFPHAVHDHQALLNSLLSVNPHELIPWVDFWLEHPESEFLRSLNQISISFDMPARTNGIQFLKDLTPVSQDIASHLQTAKKLSHFESTQISEELRHWSHLLSLPSASSDRKMLQEWSESSSFGDACKLFSDSGWIDEAYQFLESVNQNPDSKIFLRSCKNFLDVH